MRRTAKFGAATLVVILLLSAGVGTLMGSGVLHPMRKPFTPEDAARGKQAADKLGATLEDLEVRATDATLLRGWKVRPASPNGDWVLLFHGVSDNRMGVLGHAELLLRHGYSVVMMDARAHGASEGEQATYGWLERYDTRAVTDALVASEQVHCLFELGESMGASIALQAAAVDERIQGVVAESAFANLREVSYDYAGLGMGHWLGRTILRPVASMGIRGAEKEGGFKAADVSPEKAVAERAFPVVLICGEKDRNIPPRHTRRIYKAANGPKELWIVPGATHTGALGTAPEEFERRVTAFYQAIHAAR